MNKRGEHVRLAFRLEGRWWVCYLAKPGTMDGAVELARIVERVAEDDEVRKLFTDLMRRALLELCEEVFGERPEHVATRPAPESERGGNA
jgi:hypothetical protein